MDHLNSGTETDRLFAETDTLYDFFELEELWEANHQEGEHSLKRFIHKITDDDYKFLHSKKHNS